MARTSACTASNHGYIRNEKKKSGGETDSFNVIKAMEGSSLQYLRRYENAVAIYKEAIITSLQLDNVLVTLFERRSKQTFAVVTGE